MVQILNTITVQICSIWCIYKRSRSPKHIFRSSRLFLDYPDTFSKLSGHFKDHPETFQIIQIHFQIIQTLFRVSRYIFQSIRALFTSSGNITVHPYTFQIFRKLSSSSVHFVSYLDILYSIWTFSKISGNSSANNELVAKTFPSALLTRWRFFSDSALHWTHLAYSMVATLTATGVDTNAWL